MRSTTVRVPFRIHSLYLPVLFTILMLSLFPTISALHISHQREDPKRPEITSGPPSSTINADPLHIRKRTDSDSDRITKSPTQPQPASATDSITRPSIIRPSISDSVGSEIIKATPTVPVGPLPSAFDTNIGNSSFSTQSCKTFFQQFLTNSTFIECHPVSILLPSSKSWFNAAKSFVSITRALDASCSVNSAQCASVLSRLAREIGTKEACEKDLAGQNPLVITARNGFLAYKYVHDATCLKNPDTGSYCLADALASENTVGNTFVYHLALGSPLPGSTRPECNKCLEATMKVYSEGAGVQQQPLSQTYKSAAQQINIGCGPSFVSEVVKTGAAGTLVLPSHTLYVLLPLIAYVFLGILR
ncbi:hypothetical protein PRK78_004231 [Emydomyces testavorans]|uniref:DUF7729 domain-containing protein n=1 Tax=Emydomyces testavorans TaxID=2070801 RepID=A0AAF0DIE5_9EURO|nr:hypothetical protein PRK78_004231 [Emydomyces testavorans]